MMEEEVRSSLSKYFFGTAGNLWIVVALGDSHILIPILTAYIYSVSVDRTISFF